MAVMNNRDKKGYSRLRALQHIAMGSVYLLFSVLIIYIKYFGTLELPPAVAYLIGGMMALYGVFRIWRGFADMKNIPKRDMRREFPSLHDIDDKE